MAGSSVAHLKHLCSVESCTYPIIANLFCIYHVNKVGTSPSKTGTKTCTRCLQTKHYEEFHRRRKSGKIRALAVDHCHKTKKVRKLLCHKCNSALGNFEDNVMFLEEAIKYLKENKR